MDVVALLARSGGVARARDLLAAGASPALLTRAVRNGVVLRVARGVYALPDHDAGARTALSLGSELGCISAAQLRGLWVLRPPRLLHVTADSGHGIDSDRVRVHRAARPVSDLTVCLQVMRCLPELDALCIVESAVVRGSVSLEDLRGQALGRRSGSVRRIVGSVDPHAESILETVARYHLLRAGFQVSSQVHIPGVGRLDLFVDGILGIEADGRQHHSDRREFKEDRRRWNILTTRGVPVLRVTRSLLFDAPGQFLQLVRATLATRSSH
ncbi:type IV toxin-antitoxin system AbiEi family antitoxin domain-containing protein [Arthrobacter sp. TmT3-37]